MRAHGVLSDIPEAGATDHVCWVYDDEAAFDRAVEDFLTGGLRRGDRLLCVGERVIQSLSGLRSPAADVPSLIATGALETQTLAEAYEAAGRFAPADQLSFYAAATRRAVADGYRGLRVIAEVSDLAEDPVTRPRLVHWEHVADHLVAQDAGFTALCAYRGDLSRAALADVAVAHPLVHAPDEVVPFRSFFDDDGRIAVAGSVDTFSADRLARALAAAPLGADGAVLDLGLLEFADVAACRAIVVWAMELDERAVPLAVHGAAPLFRRMWRILSPGDLAHVRFAEPAA